MPYNAQNRPQGLLNTLALYSAALTVSMALWVCFGLATGMIEPYPLQEPICGTADFTDSYLECMYGPLDLTPIEDEAQIPTKEGN